MFIVPVLLFSLFILVFSLETKVWFNFLLCLSSVLFPLFCYKWLLIQGHKCKGRMRTLVKSCFFRPHSRLVCDGCVPSFTSSDTSTLRTSPTKNIHLYLPWFLHLHFFLSLISATASSTIMSSFFPTPLLLLGKCTSHCSHGWLFSKWTFRYFCGALVTDTFVTDSKAPLPVQMVSRNTDMF